MPYPRLSDDGRVVTLDLHGVRVGQAERYILRVVRAAAESGRDRVRLVHGASTSRTDYRNRTIKHLILDMLESGRLEPWVADSLPGEGATTLALALGSIPNPRRLTWTTIG